MKFLKKSIYALSLVSMMGLWSCSQEEMLPGGDVTAKGHLVPVTLTVSRGDAQTRTELSENYATGGLNDVWVSGDQLHVYNSIGKEVGQLNLTDGFDTPVGVFYGEIEAEQGEQELALWYYDNVESNPNLSFGRYSGDDVIVLDLKNQSFADVKALSKVDVLSKKVTLNVNGDKTTVIKDEVLTPYLTFARFSLKGDLPEGTKGTLNIYNLSSEGTNSDGVYHNTLNTIKFKLKEATSAVKSSDKKDIVVSNVEAGKDVYVALVPGTDFGKTPTETDGVKLGFTFTAANGDVYKFGFENPTVLYAGKYYNSFLKNEGEETGTISGVEIPMVKVGTPLSKWAETNLERVSDEEYYKGKFAASYADDGHFYQFGRNVGFEDYNEASVCAFIYSSSSDISFGLGNGSSYPKASYYTSNNLKTGLRPNGFMIPCYGGAEDWWPSTTARSDTWDQRATASGYTPSDLYVIDGVKWKIPSVADYQEILPSKEITTAFTSYEEVKTINNKKYAFRWKKVNEGGSYYLQIKAKNINKDSEASDIDWESTTDLGIDTRYFKAAGFIYPLYFANNVYSKILDVKYEEVYNPYYGWQNQPTSALIEYVWEEDYSTGYEYNGMMEAAKAMPAGHYNYSDIESVWANVIRQPNGNMTTDDMIDVTLGCQVNYSKYVGTYWTADKGRNVLEFIFDDNNVVGADGIYISGSDASACSIRLIRAE